MLRKLIKHEFRATAHLMLPLFVLAPVTAIGGNISVKYLMESESNALNIIGLILLTAFAVAMAAVCIMAVVVMVQRFYKNLLQDEGYIMLTLPVSVHQHIWSKLIVSIVWFALSCVIVLLSIFILVYDMGMLREFFHVFDLILEEISTLRESGYLTHMIFIAIELILMLIAGSISSCLHFYTALSMGHSFAKSKMLLSVVLYFAVSFAMQIINGIVAAFAGNTGLAESFFDRFVNLQGVAGTHPVMIIFILYNALFGAILYFLTVFFMKKRLNLE